MSRPVIYSEQEFVGAFLEESLGVCMQNNEYMEEWGEQC